MSGVLQALLAGFGGAATDEYFEYVTMLLPGNGTNGAQNNTFLDSSTNNFTITRNGNTTQGTFTPYGSNWSNYFSGGPYLSVANNTAFEFGSGNFTIEAWVNFSSLNSTSGIINLGSDKNVDYSYGIQWQFGGTLHFWYSTNGSTTNRLSFAWAPAVGQWYHIAATRSGTTFTFFINGAVLGTDTLSGTLFDTTASLVIGAGVTNLTGDLTGYISNLRLVKGTALYTSAFTPSTSPLTAVSGTGLLTCQSSRFIDNSGNAFTVTASGPPSVQRFSPFNPTTPYAAGTIGGSGYFDGTGDYLVAPNDAAFAFGTGNFTVEAWVYGSLPGSGQSFIIGNVVDSSGSNEVLAIYLGSSGQIITSTWFTVLSTSASNVFMSNAWNHIAVARSGSTMSVFVNGTRVNTFSNSTNFSVTTGYRLGVEGTSSRFFTGYISNARVVKGTAVYDPSQTTITVPTSPLTAITNTSLLLNFTNGGIIDNAMMNDLETVGNAQISTSVSKFGGGSLAFDGTGDYLFAPSRATTSLEGDFTIELWAYRAASGNYRAITVGDAVGTSGVEIYVSGTPTGNWVVYSNSATRITGASATREVWTHLALVRSGSTVTLYVNGTASGSTWSSSATFSGGVYVGAEFFNNSVTSDTNGYIDDLRITKGYARYTANFAAPTAPFPLN